MTREASPKGERIAAALAELGASIGQPLSVAAVTGSTNDDAREAARAGAPHGAAFVADSQTRGRGRQGHGWHSPPGENVYLSVLLRPALGAAAMAPLTLALGVGVARLVDAHLEAPRARIKWPNDIYVDERKIAGVLLEATTLGDDPPVIVAGIGLNALGRSFPEGFAAPPTSLALAGGRDLDLDLLTAELIASVGERYDAFVAAGLAPLLDELRARDFLRGRRVQVDTRSGVATGIDDDGRLLVDTAEGREAIISGSVSLV